MTGTLLVGKIFLEKGVFLGFPKYIKWVSKELTWTPRLLSCSEYRKVPSESCRAFRVCHLKFLSLGWPLPSEAREGNSAFHHLSILNSVDCANPKECWLPCTLSTGGYFQSGMLRANNLRSVFVDRTRVATRPDRRWRLLFSQWKMAWRCMWKTRWQQFHEEKTHQKCSFSAHNTASALPSF